uniref:Bifunctional lycopene cyclase/phytoene synthase n=1 Tax=Aurantiochytrium sp. KH105 TaxID=2010233 RepID=A0A3Q9WAL0_9STRA|nr:beta-carotene synthase.[1] [Aurantiochytrium sp. KH105]
MARRASRPVAAVVVVLVVVASACCWQAAADVADAQGARGPGRESDGDRAKKRIAVLGAGYAGLSAACELSRLGHEVVVLEKNDYVGGRAHQFEVEADNGQTFKFDAGPSWYWMPEVFDRFFARYGRTVQEFYQLERLDPAYRIIRNDHNGEGTVDVPGASSEAFMSWARQMNGDARLVDRLMDEAKAKYEEGVFKWIWHPMVSWWEMIDLNLVRAALQYDMFNSFVAHLQKYISSDTLLMILKWPVIFLGASPNGAPALYSMMTYGGHALGTFYPTGGLARPVVAIAELAKDLGVDIQLDAEVTSFRFDETGRGVQAVCTRNDRCEAVDGVVAAADYHHVEQTLLPPELRRYEQGFWDAQVMSPSCVLFYLGFDHRIQGLTHHTFFFDRDLDAHLHAAFDTHTWAEEPVFYVSATSKTDPSVVTGQGEALFVLVPISYQLNGTDNAARREQILHTVLTRMEENLKQPLREWLVYQKSYGTTDFERDFHSFRGNAFGHANTLSQSLVLKPSMDSLLNNLVFAGHLTNPGPGVPPSIVSGTVSANLLHDKLQVTANHHLLGFTLLGALLGALFLGILTLSVFSTRFVSYVECIRLLYVHGRTYFAAATLMKPMAFLDTAAMYGLFRVADDYVDNVGDAGERQRNLDAFMADFWRCWESGRGDYARHPTLPAIIESAHRRAYPRELFERFFRSMRMDAKRKVVCLTMDDTMEYMEGSAAVIGEFMLPILMPDRDSLAFKQAIPHARDLGLAFQITNMLRDIGEDNRLGRQYIPVDACNRHGLNGKLTSHEQPGFRELMEEMFAFTDNLYASADLGIDMLPEQVRDVIRVARLAYHRIHDKIRAANYDIFTARRRVPLREKLTILVDTVPRLKLARIALTELICAALYGLSRPHIAFVWIGAVWASWLEWPGCSYLRFHGLFVVPPLLMLARLAHQRAVADKQVPFLRRAGFWTLALCVVATLYTTPWDNFLVYRRVWGYPPERILFVIGYVPVEEYMFFTLETMLVAAVWLQVFQPTTLQAEVGPRGKGGMLVLASLGLVWIAGLSCLASEQSLYIGLILTWAMPVLILQWSLGAHVLTTHAKPVLTTIVSATAYLCVADAWAIRHGIWRINPANLVLPMGKYALPLEEALFFLVTSIMCTWGLTLAMVLWGKPIGLAVGVGTWARPPRPGRTQLITCGAVLVLSISHPALFKMVPALVVTIMRFGFWACALMAGVHLPARGRVLFAAAVVAISCAPAALAPLLAGTVLVGTLGGWHTRDRDDTLPLYKNA